MNQATTVTSIIKRSFFAILLLSFGFTSAPPIAAQTLEDRITANNQAVASADFRIAVAQAPELV